MQTNWIKQAVRAVGVGIVVFATDLMVYPEPPDSAEAFWVIAWLPMLKAIVAMGGAFGINMATRQTPPVPHP